MKEEFNTDAVELVRAILSEHFNNYAFVVLEDDGTLFYDYTNHILGETLFVKSLEDMQAEMMSEALSGLDWEEDEEEDGA